MTRAQGRLIVVCSRDFWKDKLCLCCTVTFNQAFSFLFNSAQPIVITCAAKSFLHLGSSKLYLQNTAAPESKDNSRNYVHFHCRDLDLSVIIRAVKVGLTCPKKLLTRKCCDRHFLCSYVMHSVM